MNALEPPEGGIEVKGLRVRSFPAMESLTYDVQGEPGRDPDANALYIFTLDGLRVLHMGDIGNKVPTAHIAALKGQVDVMLALTGAHATIALDDLDAAIEAIGPRAVIPMHYYSPKGMLKIEPVEIFLRRVPDERITRVGGPEMELTADQLPQVGAPPRVFVFEQSR